MRILVYPCSFRSAIDLRPGLFEAHCPPKLRQLHPLREVALIQLRHNILGRMRGVDVADHDLNFKPWSQVNGATVNVTLWVDATALDVLDGGRHILDGSTTKWPVAGWIRRTGSADSAGRLAKMREAAQIRWTAGIAASGANHRRTICCPLGALCMRWC